MHKICFEDNKGMSGGLLLDDVLCGEHVFVAVE